LEKVTLIISVYKKTNELGLVFDALKLQSFKEFEIIISDDGSGEKMKNYIEKRAKEFQIPVKFITQEDKGFRKNRILNRAVAESSSDYLIFLDGDCIPHPEFIKEHFSNKIDNAVLCGRRVMLGGSITDSLFPGMVKSGMLFNMKYRLLSDSLSGGKYKTRYVEDSIYIRNNFLRKKIIEKTGRLTGCNFSLPKNLLLKINGFDENYEGAGIGEDSDIEYRLKLAGADFRTVKNIAIVYHIFHLPTLGDEKNIQYFEGVKSKGEYFCKNGITKH